MSTLNKHYGADASLDETMAREITRWLKAHAGTYKRVRDEPPQDRITRSTWFLQKHRAAEVPSEVWSRAAVGSASNCSACHGNAAQGSFSERDIKIPK
jgi:nitrate/TMAO reductase-like tetraheme cytochrome c subunit